MEKFSCLLLTSFLFTFCSLSCLLVSGYPRTVKKCGISNVERIVGGSPVEHGEYPWMVSVYYNRIGHLCGGTILNENWIVTAAHCILSENTRKYQIFAGIHKLTDRAIFTAQKYEISKIVVHGMYNSSLKAHDIALVRTKEPIDIENSDGYVNAICLPKTNEDPDGWATVVGWGVTEEGSVEASDIMNEVHVPLIPRNKCVKAFARFIKYEGIKPWMICAGRHDKDACQSDSGGPLMQSNWKGVYTLVGVVSHGFGCGRKYYPGIYVKVSYYLPWLEQVMG